MFFGISGPAPAQADGPLQPLSQLVLKPGQNPASVAKTITPLYLSLRPDLNQYYLYADGGMDGNWYVGYNNCWIVKLPPAPRGNFQKAFIGAKLGRAKTQAVEGKPLEKKAKPGKIYIGISHKPSFSSEQSFFLVSAGDIPLEPPENDSMPGTGSAEWFWAKVPLEKISTERPNYIALWSNSEYFTSSSSSPILAGAETTAKQENVWFNRSITGAPPRSIKTALETPVFRLQPAMAIKLIPKNNYTVSARGLMATITRDEIIVRFSANGTDVRGAWIEISYDRFDWQRISRVLSKPPFSFTFNKKTMPQDLYYLRGAAADCLENIGHSKEIMIKRQ